MSQLLRIPLEEVPCSLRRIVHTTVTEQLQLVSSQGIAESGVWHRDRTELHNLQETQGVSSYFTLFLFKLYQLSRPPPPPLLSQFLFLHLYLSLFLSPTHPLHHSQEPFPLLVHEIGDSQSHTPTNTGNAMDHTALTLLLGPMNECDRLREVRSDVL